MGTIQWQSSAPPSRPSAQPAPFDSPDSPPGASPLPPDDEEVVASTNSNLPPDGSGVSSPARRLSPRAGSGPCTFFSEASSLQASPSPSNPTRPFLPGLSRRHGGD